MKSLHDNRTAFLHHLPNRLCNHLLKIDQKRTEKRNNSEVFFIFCQWWQNDCKFSRQCCVNVAYGTHVWVKRGHRHGLKVAIFSSLLQPSFTKALASSCVWKVHAHQCTIPPKCRPARTPCQLQTSIYSPKIILTRHVSCSLGCHFCPTLGRGRDLCVHQIGWTHYVARATLYGTREWIGHLHDNAHVNAKAWNSFAYTPD